MATITRTIPPITEKELIALQEFVTIPTYLIKELPQDKLCALMDILSMADENGEIFVTQRMLMERWKWGNTKVRNFIDYLIEKGLCKPKTNHETNQKQTRVFTVNAEFSALLQTKNKPRNKPKTNREKEGLQAEASRNHSGELEEKTGKKEQVYYPNDEKLNQAFLDFMEMRKSIKKPMTDRAITMAMNRLKKLAGNDNDLAIRILEQSIFHSWQDVYELKEDKQGNSYAKNGDRDILSEWRDN